MPKITPKKKSSTTSKPIALKTMGSATNASGSSIGTTGTIPKHVIPIKKHNSIWLFPGTPHSYRHVRINANSYLIIATYLEKVEKDKKDKKPIKIGDKFMVLDPLSYYNEIRVTSIDPDKKKCSVLRINNNKTYTFKDRKSLNYKKMAYDFVDGKAKTLISTLKNQSFYIRTHYMIKLFYDDYESDAIVFKKV